MFTGFSCELCGLADGDPHPIDPSLNVGLVVADVSPHRFPDGTVRSDRRLICTACDEGRASRISEDALTLLVSIRRTSREAQREVYDALKRTFEP